MNTIDEAIEILQAMKEGKTLQIRSGGGWVDRSPAYANVLPRFQDNNYRVKPEPAVDWIVECIRKSGNNWSCFGTYSELTETRMREVIQSISKNNSLHRFRARKITPVEEALT